MTEIRSLFVTRLYCAQLDGLAPGELEASCMAIAEEDEAGHAWCEEKGFPGYTSYASLTDLPWRMPIFADLVKALDAHVAEFAKDLAFNLDGRPLVLEDIWINVLPPGGIHTGHLHPHSVISGTTYVAVPEGAAAIRFEDPRHAMMMAAPPRDEEAREEMQSFVYIAPRPGDVLLWESWLRHEVPMNMSEEDNRISVSFNYAWGSA